jgi:hypothetical protein
MNASMSSAQLALLVQFAEQSVPPVHVTTAAGVLAEVLEGMILHEVSWSLAWVHSSPPQPTSAKMPTNTAEAAIADLRFMFVFTLNVAVTAGSQAAGRRGSVALDSR